MALVDSFESIIFDYGGVLVEQQSKADQARMAALVGLSPGRFSELYWATRADYDRADLSAAEYWTGIAQETGRPVHPKLLDELTSVDSQSWMRFDDAMWEWVSHLRKMGKRTAMLSNMPLELGEALKIQPRRLELFDQVTLSYEVRFTKPQPQIYEQCLEGLGAEPQEALFFDDRIENVQGAELLGLRAIQFLDRDAVLLQVR